MKYKSNLQIKSISNHLADSPKSVSRGEPEIVDHFEGYWGIKKAAKYLDLTEGHVRKLVHQKRIKSYRFINRLRFKKEDLDSLVMEK